MDIISLSDKGLKLRIRAYSKKQQLTKDEIDDLKKEVNCRIELCTNQDEKDKWDKYLNCIEKMYLNEIFTDDEEEIEIIQDKNKDFEIKSQNSIIKDEIKLLKGRKINEPLDKIAKSIPKFNGDLSQWSAFKEIIEEAIINDNEASILYRNIIIMNLLEGQPKSFWLSGKSAKLTLNTARFTARTG